MIVVVGTSSRGGIKSVIDSYVSCGLYAPHDYLILETHGEYSVYKRVFVFLRVLLMLTKLLISRRVSLLHAHSAMRGSFWRKAILIVLCKSFRVPVVLHLHGSEFKVFYSKLGCLFKSLVSYVFRLSDQVWVLSNSWQEFVLKVSPKADVRVIPNFVVNSKSCCSSVVGEKSHINVLFLGYVGDRKGIFDLIKAAQQLPVKEHFKFFVGGNGDIERAIAFAKDCGVSQSFNFLGWVDGTKKEALLKSADIFVLPSHNEGLPVSLLEAMSYKVPVISTTVGGIPELLLDGGAGLLVPPGRPDLLSVSLIDLSDSNKRQIIGNLGYEHWLNHYSLDAVRPLICKNLSELVKT
ncbi:glycosyltransferase family 1 protein [Aquabacterium lacunae]|uniref:Glycosyltransferase family 1 protein n=1 Tax=Aquabacterium lacunae TaxID=2528630 RepID=A0A4Q9GVZ7_9BURK|nr:glycosyltransferase family 4 protein [Aquabacterium lacunae]TBO28309.1 glycosyltransferase family 1 protein [Aquabacterium lacunae]